MLSLGARSSGDRFAARPRRASPLARAALLAFFVVAVYAGLAPWSGWRDLGISPWAFLSAPVPRHLPRFDIALNVFAYLPLGALAVLALHPRWRGGAAVAIATAMALALSGSIEAAQTWLPQRVSSHVDLLTNVAGALLGALLTAPVAPALIDGDRLTEVRARWFTRDAAVLLVVLALWLPAQTYPGPMLFGNGQALDLSGWAAPLLGFADAAELHAAFGPGEFMLVEALTVTAGVLAAGLALAAVMRPAAPRVRLLAALLALALAAKSLAYAVLFGPERALVWLTPGAFGGLAVGALALVVAAYGSARAVARGALVAAVVWLVVVNVVPENPYHADWLADFRPGRLLHLNALSAWLAGAWPYVLMAALLALIAGRRGDPRAGD